MKMLIQSSLPNSLSTGQSFTSDLGKHHDMELLCDWSNFDGIWQKSPNDKFPIDKCRKSNYTEEDGRDSEIDKMPGTSCDIINDKDSVTNFASRWDGLVYKRRRLRSTTVTMMSAENVVDCNKGTNCSNLSIISASQNDRILVNKEVAHLAENLNSEHNSHINATYLSSNCNGGNDAAECSSSHVILRKPLEESTSSRELCVDFLKRNGLLFGTNNSNACDSSEFLSSDDASISCKVCNLLENPMKMLICDHCEDSFHVSCCQPKVTKLPADYWYCKPCFRKRPKALLDKSSVNILSKHKYRKSCSREGPILRMLRDNRPYTSGVGIGPDFQAQVPQWTGPVSDDFNYFDEHSELDLAECASLNDRNAESSSISNSIGNWIQCRAVVYKNSKYKRTICGKWRRAPLFVVQTDGWDCSCSVLWDPIHADCAVPQELETDMVFEHLRYFEMLRSRLAINKRWPSETRTEGP